MRGEIYIWLAKTLLHLLEEALGDLDLWWLRTFGRSLSGRFFSRIEFQTLFHGNIKDDSQI
jgi:hypothetical protein